MTLNFPEVRQVSWHFFATSHGKGPIDGLGGTIKHIITEYSMANVVTTEDFSKLANNSCPNILIDYVSKSKVKQFIVETISVMGGKEMEKT